MQKLSKQAGPTTSLNRQRVLTRFLRYFLILLYHQLAWSYDWVASVVSLGAWQKWINSIIPYLDKQPTLEIGFGPGQLQAALEKNRIVAFGLDESAQMSQLAWKRLKRLSLQPRLVRGDACSLPFAGQSFQQIVMTFPSEYILEQKTLKEIYRILIDRGHAFILPLAWITGQSVLQRAAAWLNYVSDEAPPWNEEYFDHFKRPGFVVEREFLDLGDSRVLIIKMEKIPSGQRGKPGS